MDIPALIESAAGGNVEDFRNLMLAMYEQFNLVNTTNGLNWLRPGNLGSYSTPPPAATAKVSGANGLLVVQVTNPTQAANSVIYHEISYSTVKNFSQNVQTLPRSSATSFVIPTPGSTVFVRLRSSYNGSAWNNYQNLSTTAVSAGLQSSAATENNVVLNQSNFATVDSVANGATAAIRVYGVSGPYHSYVQQKGSVQSTRPSATIVGATYGSSHIIGWDGLQFRVTSILPGVFPDSWEPVGKVSVVNSGAPSLPTLTPIISGGHLIGATWTGDSGLTAPPTLTVTDTGGGLGAVIICTAVTAGMMDGVQVLNPGSGYSGATVITASGGVGPGSVGGGTAIGGNGGRLTAL